MGSHDDKELDPDFLGYGTVLTNALTFQRSNISTGMSSRLGTIYQAQLVLLACFGSIHARPDRAFDEIDVIQKVHRAAIHCAVIQGVELVETAIASAAYPQAATLVRQEIEAVEAGRGLRKGLQEEGKTPRLKALCHIGRSYGQLSSIAHLSRSDMLTEITDVLATGIDPALNERFEKHLFCLHLLALVGVCVDAAELRPFTSEQMFDEQEALWLQSVCGLLSAEGYLTVKV